MNTECVRIGDIIRVHKSLRPPGHRGENVPHDFYAVVDRIYWAQGGREFDVTPLERVDPRIDVQRINARAVVAHWARAVPPKKSPQKSRRMGGANMRAVEEFQRRLKEMQDGT